MDSIFFERQEGQLCAQHCLNSLLQAPIFTAVDLAGYAEQLDQEERARMAEGGFSSPEFLRFMQQPSSNMDDSGFFSVQVIAKALSVWNLELESLASPHMKGALEDPTTQKAFICNHNAHWLTVRKLGHQWFNLNSLLKRPELISDTYLSLFLHQLQMEGYSIFVVIGALPDCEADQVLSLVRVQPPSLSLPTSSSSSSSSSHPRPSPSDTHSPHQPSSRSSHSSGPQNLLKQSFSSVVRGAGAKRKREEDLQMAMALSASLEERQEQFEINQQLQFQRMQEEAEGEDPSIYGQDEVSGDYVDEEEEAALTAAIYASLEDGSSGSVPTTSQSGGRTSECCTSDKSEKTTAEEEEEKKSEREAKSPPSVEARGDETGDVGSAGLPASQEELRRRRLQHLDQKKSTSN